MHTAAHAALRAFADYSAARQARSDLWLDELAEYRACSVAEVASWRLLVTAMDELKSATAADGVRVAAESGSRKICPKARR